MKLLLLAFFVAAAFAAPAPMDDEDVGEPVEVIVNGLPEGEPLEVGDIVDIKLQEHVDGELASATNLLHPFSALGLAEAAAAAEAEAEAEIDAPGSDVLPPPVAPEVDGPVVVPSPGLPEVDVPETEVLPGPALPEIDVPGSVVLPEPGLPEVVLPGPALPEIVLPGPALPEVVLPGPALPEVVVPEPGPEVLPAPQPLFPNGEIFNDGTVQLTVNTAQDAGIMATLQSWFNMVVNYISDGVQTTQQIV